MRRSFLLTIFPAHPTILSRTERPRDVAQYYGVMSQVSPVIEPEVVEPVLDEDDHERFSHIVLEGYTPTKGFRKKFVPIGNSVVEGMINGTPVEALCGKKWIPGKDPKKYQLCPTCKELAASKGWKVPGV